MKKILYLSLCLPLMFSSCKKEEKETNNNNSSSIIGYWTVNTINLESETGWNTFYPEDIEFLTGLDFITGGILYEYRDGDLDTNEWVIIGDSLYIGEDGEDFISKHEVTNTNLTLKGPIDDDNMWGANTLTINATRNQLNSNIIEKKIGIETKGNNWKKIRCWNLK